MRLRIESDGTAPGTHVLTENGDVIHGVRVVEWRCRPGQDASALLEVNNVPAALAVLADVTITDTPPR